MPESICAGGLLVGDPDSGEIRRCDPVDPAGCPMETSCDPQVPIFQFKGGIGWAVQVISHGWYYVWKV